MISGNVPDGNEIWASLAWSGLVWSADLVWSGLGWAGWAGLGRSNPSRFASHQNRAEQKKEKKKEKIRTATTCDKSQKGNREGSH